MGEYRVKKKIVENKPVFPVNFFPFSPFNESLSKAATHLMKSSENTNVLTPCQGIINIMFACTTEESKKVKGRDNYVEMLWDMKLFLMKKNWRVTKCIFYIVCEFHHLKIITIVHREKGTLKYQGRINKEQQLN